MRVKIVRSTSLCVSPVSRKHAATLPHVYRPNSLQSRPRQRNESTLSSAVGRRLLVDCWI